MWISIDTLKADSLEKVLKQYWLTKAVAIYQMFPHLPLEIYFSQYVTKLYLYV
jgi:hypothetical protein